MKKQFKKFLGLTLTLLLAFPILANAASKSQIAQEELENQIYSLLQQGKYDMVRNTLSKISVCPKSGITEAKLPTVPCTLNKFNPDPFKMTNPKEIDVKINLILPDHPGYTKSTTLTVVRPVQALKNSLAKQYKERFGRDISKYNKDGYLQFPEPYKGSWLENVIPSFLAQQIWTKDPNLLEWTFSFYNDAMWHKAQGINYDEAAKSKYAWVPEVRYREYNPFDNLRHFDLVEFWYRRTMIRLNILYDMCERDNNKDIFLNYSKHIFRGLFNMNHSTTSEECDCYDTEREFTPKQHAAAIIYLFDKNNYVWRYTQYMPADVLKEMRDNIAQYVTEACVDPDYIHKTVDCNIYTHERNYDAKKVCNNFIKNAKEYGVWTDEAEKNYKNLLKQKNAQENAEIQEEVETKTNSLIQNMLQGIAREGQQKISY